MSDLDFAGLTEAEFLAAFAAAYPVALDISMETSFRDLSADKVSASATRAILASLIPGAPPDLIDSMESMRDAYEWYRVRYGEEREVSSNMPRVRLRPLSDQDLGPLYVASTRPEQGFRWRFRGSTPSFQDFHASLFDGVLAQFMVVDSKTGSPFGLVCAYNARFEIGCVHIGFVRTFEGKGQGEVLEGMLMFIEFLFQTWPFKKIYADVPEFNAQSMFDTNSKAVRVEGRLVQHCFHDGQWWDQLTIALWREDWTVQKPNWGVATGAGVTSGS